MEILPWMRDNELQKPNFVVVRNICIFVKTNPAWFSVNTLENEIQTAKKIAGQKFSLWF